MSSLFSGRYCPVPATVPGCCFRSVSWSLFLVDFPRRRRRRLLFPVGFPAGVSGRFPGRCFRSVSRPLFPVGFLAAVSSRFPGSCFRSVSRPLFPVGFAFSFLSAVSGCCSHSFFSDSATVSDHCPRSFFSGFSPEAVLKKRRGDGIVRKCPERGAFEPVRTRNHSPETP